ncbi:hypothetical protein Tco_1161478, partial [Tanacetum coccineum]
MCRVLGYQPSLDTFRRFYVNSISNGWMSFSRRGPTPYCLLKKFDSLKNWNDHFFWIDASICPISVPWHTGTSILKDPLPSDNRVNAELLTLLDHHRTITRRYPETFLCVVGLSCSFNDVLIVDHTIVDEVKEHAGKKKRRVVFEELPVNRLRADVAAAYEAAPNTGGKSLTALRRLELQNGPVVLGDSVYSGWGCSNSHRASMRIDVSSSSWGLIIEVAAPGFRILFAAFAEGVGASGNNVEASTSVPDTASPTDDFYDSQSVETDTADKFMFRKWGVTNGARVDKPFALCPRARFSPLPVLPGARARPPARFATSTFNINSAHHTCMVSELRLRLEEAQCEAAEVFALRGHISELETRMAVKSEEVNALNKQNVELLSKEAVGEAKLREEFKSFQDAEAHRFDQRSAELDARIADVMYDMDNDLYPYMFTAIARQRVILNHGVRLAVMKCAQSTECRSALGKVISLAINKGIEEVLEAGIEHGKSGRTLDQVEAYNPEFKDEFVSVVTDFENVSFALLDELESLKDSPLVSIT